MLERIRYEDESRYRDFFSSLVVTFTSMACCLIPITGHFLVHRALEHMLCLLSLNKPQLTTIKVGKIMDQESLSGDYVH